MPAPDALAFELGGRFSLVLERPPARGVSGAHLGRGSGASLEFQERRAYAPGDDVRHVDWRALARTGQLWVRVYREEILPRVELVIDGSLSMGVDPDKARLATDLLALLGEATRGAGAEAALFRAGERMEPLPDERFRERGVAFDSALPLSAPLGETFGLLRSGSHRVLVSDFLFPHEPRALLAPLAATAGGLLCVQLLGAGDAEPAAGEPLRLVDAETGALLDVVVDEAEVRRYRARLDALTAGLRDECRRLGARFLVLRAGAPLLELVREQLLPAGVLEPQ